MQARGAAYRTLPIVPREGGLHPRAVEKSMDKEVAEGIGADAHTTPALVTRRIHAHTHSEWAALSSTDGSGSGYKPGQKSAPHRR